MKPNRNSLVMGNILIKNNNILYSRIDKCADHVGVLPKTMNNGGYDQKKKQVMYDVFVLSVMVTLMLGFSASKIYLAEQ
jgi:hypothetical protein